LVRASVGCILMVIISAAGMDAFPYRPLEVLLAGGLLWLMGTGLGLILSVLAVLVPEVSRVLSMISLPLYLLSGVLYPLAMVPPYLHSILLLNPIVHGLEYMRSAFFPAYYLSPLVDITYLGSWAVSLLFLGLALHVRFARRLAFK
jgi:capsular polysaccharide transport system permease protein